MSFSHYVPTLAPDEQPEPRLAPRVWAGAILMVASLGFFVIGGCFALGILVLLNPSGLNGNPAPSALSGEETTLLVTLYVLAGLSVVAAAVLFLLGMVGLVRVLHGKATPT